jgi:NADPH:quinone reductase-like Zn-dependent oxidoreductase
MEGERRNLPRALRTVATMPRFNLIRQMSSSRAVIGLNMLRIWDAHGASPEDTAGLGELVSSGAVRPVVAETFPLERGGEAHRFVAERKNVGKVVLTV